MSPCVCWYDSTLDRIRWLNLKECNYQLTDPSDNAPSQGLTLPVSEVTFLPKNKKRVSHTEDNLQTLRYIGKADNFLKNY